MTKPLIRSPDLDILLMAAEPSYQDQAKAALKGSDTYHRDLLATYLSNPFLRLSDDEAAQLATGLDRHALSHLLAARHAASGGSGRRITVCCMPKSGSTFLSAALEHALELPSASLTGFGRPDIASHFGMNSREQEWDELAIVKAALTRPKGFVAQNHTRYSTYLALQMRLYGITPIVTVRNILDCIVSFDDMTCRGRAQVGRDWRADTQFALPLNYPELPAGRRYELLARSFGVWLISFYLSWKRSAQRDLVDPVFVRYEDETLDPDRLTALMRERLGLSDRQAARLSDYARNPDRRRARFNVGVTGRGRDRIPQEVKAFLTDHIGLFAEEITEDEVRYLIH